MSGSSGTVQVQVNLPTVSMTVSFGAQLKNGLKVPSVAFNSVGV